MRDHLGVWPGGRGDAVAGWDVDKLTALIATANVPGNVRYAAAPF
jgi:hypothetical protein